MPSLKVAGVREAIESTGATQCFSPAYSPDLDPIEQVFAKLTNTQRKMAHPTVDALWEGNGSALDGFAPNECLKLLPQRRIWLCLIEIRSNCPI